MSLCPVTYIFFCRFEYIHIWIFESAIHDTSSCPELDAVFQWFPESLAGIADSKLHVVHYQRDVRFFRVNCTKLSHTWPAQWSVLQAPLRVYHVLLATTAIQQVSLNIFVALTWYKIRSLDLYSIIRKGQTFTVVDRIGLKAVTMPYGKCYFHTLISIPD